LAIKPLPYTLSMSVRPTRPTVCLNMIVKNEAHVIARCLNSARPLIDRWCIVDTGSTDDTERVIRETLAGIPGTLHSRPWQNFGHNRSEAIELARQERCDYLLFIDADELFDVPADFAWPESMTADAYELTCLYSGVSYARLALAATRLPWRWVGVLHEYPDCGSPHVTQALGAPKVIIHHDGARARDESTYLKDIAILERAVRDDPSNTRNIFYLAQSYRDAGRVEESRTTYVRRTAMGGWDEERWYALFQVATLTERLNEPHEDIVAAYLQAFSARPTRAEPLVELARFYRLSGHYALAYLYAKHACGLPPPPDRLFVDQSAYTWRALDELAISAFYVGSSEARRDGAQAAERLMTEGALPASEMDRVAKNRAFYAVP
jgi:glycosyltransferase involved in cell wall biosynthesis